MAEKKPPKRSIQLIRSTKIDGIGVLRIAVVNQSALYAVCELPCEIGGRGFAMHRLGLGDLYHIRVGQPADCSCECLGFLRHGRCKHISGLLALVRKGEI